MRTLVLLFVLAAPSLMFCCAARAAASADLGKPVCTHYDDSSKAADGHANPAASGASTSTVAGSPAPSPGGLSPATTAKSGGSASDMRARNAPRWQAFLPGMFR